jgi:hypothetical protein
LTVTPSLAVFGGNARADQTLSQAFTQFLGGGVLETASYAASTRLEWTDVGARAGLHLRSAVTPSFSIGLGGSAALAARRVSFSGNDVSSSSNAGIITGSSTLSLSDSKTPLLANAEAHFAWQLTPWMTVRGFAGLNYDSDVPGIAGPSYAGSILAPTRSAASLFYDHRTSVYAGGGLTRHKRLRAFLMQ